MKTESDVVRAICDEEPLRPSETVAPDQPRRRELRGDLDLIVLKALRKDRARRYATVEQLADDVGRHVNGRPVLARPDSVRYRASKFVTRHKAGVAASSLMLVLLIGSLAVTAWEAHVAQLQKARAERRFNDVRRLANSFLFEFHDAIEGLPGSTKARELLVRRANEDLNSLSSESADDASLQRELAAAYEKVGDVQGLPSFANLGDTVGALQSHKSALALRTSLASATPADSVRQRELATTHHHLGAILSQMGDLKTALDHERQSLAIHQTLLALDPGAVSERRALAISYHWVGDIMSRLGDWNAALDNFQKEAAAFEALLSANPTSAGAQRDVAIAYKKVGAVLERNGDREAALANYRKAIALDEVRARSATDSQARLDVSFGYTSVGHLLADLRNPAGALENYQRALSLRQQVAAADPHDMNAQATVSRAQMSVGQVLRQLGRRTEAQAQFHAALDGAARRFAADPGNGDAGERVASAYSELATTSAELAEATKDKGEALGRWKDARAWSQKGIDILSGYRAKNTLSAFGKAYLDLLVGVQAKCARSLD